MNILISVPIQLPKMTTFFLQHATLEYDIALLKLDTDINFSGMKRRKTKSPSDLKMWEHAAWRTWIGRGRFHVSRLGLWKGKISTSYTSDLKTQASFVFLPQKFCGKSAKLSRKNFIILMGLPTFYLDSWYYLRKKINTEKINFTDKQYFLLHKTSIKLLFWKLLIS